MNENDFDGSLVLEKIAAVGKYDEFFEAIDSDNFDLARALMRGARLDSTTIAWVLLKMEDADGKH